MKSEIRPQDIATMLHIRPCDAHKGTMGHALLVAGSHGMAGCAMLAAESCLRSGAGKVTVWTAEANRISLHCAVPEAILCLRETCDATGFQALGIGPGMGLGEEAAHRLHCLLAQSKAPLVLDADALHLLAAHTEWAELLAGRAILTPHAGEMRHLSAGFGLEADVAESACKLAAAKRLTIVLKGHPTLICFPDGSAVECMQGNPGMATAGSGDVLTGLVAGLLAQGYTTAEAAQLAVWLHATAGDIAAEEMGEECMLARDILRHLPDAFRSLKNRL